MATSKNKTLVADDNRLEGHREIIKRSLDQVAVEVEIALQDANLKFPIFLVIPNSGTAIITVATSLDPPDVEWSQASAIVCRIVGERLGGIKLGNRPLQCATANARFIARVDNLDYADVGGDQNAIC